MSSSRKYTFPRIRQHRLYGSTQKKTKKKAETKPFTLLNFSTSILRNICNTSNYIFYKVAKNKTSGKVNKPEPVKHNLSHLGSALVSGDLKHKFHAIQLK